MKALKLGAVEEFPFLQRPHARLDRGRYQTLLELGAVTKELALTELGGEAGAAADRSAHRADDLGGRRRRAWRRRCLIIAAALSVQDPRERPLDKQEAADAAHLEFRDEHSDFLAYLKLWEWYHKQAKGLSSNKLRRACVARFLSFTRMREWHDVHEQLAELLGEMREEERGGRGGRGPGSTIVPVGGGSTRRRRGSSRR